MAEKKLNPMQELFCQSYANIDSETFSYKGKSAEAAGYKTPANSATQLLANPAVQARIEQIYDKNVKKDKNRMLSVFELHRRKAFKLGKIDAANVAAKHICQILGFLKFEFVPEPQNRELTESEKVEAQRIASILHHQPPALSIPDTFETPEMSEEETNVSRLL